MGRKESGHPSLQLVHVSCLLELLSVSFDRNLILARVCFLSYLPFSWGRAGYLLGGGTFLLHHKKRFEDFYSPKLFFYITAHFCWDSFSLHNASNSFRAGSFSAVPFLFCLPLLSSVGLVFRELGWRLLAHCTDSLASVLSDAMVRL